MRMWFAADINGSDTGKWVWENKVKTSTIPRSPKLLDNIQPLLERITIDGKQAAILKMPQSRPVPFIRRLTKGLLYTFYPQYDYLEDFFNVQYERPSKRTISAKGVARHHSRHARQRCVGLLVLRCGLFRLFPFTSPKVSTENASRISGTPVATKALVDEINLLQKERFVRTRVGGVPNPWAKMARLC